ncbi:MAG: DNA-processing protein DprA [candidate division WWE3 bacterium]|nr:DNA-processing protein DprA [candidate division WWE3 bacterium]
MNTLYYLAFSQLFDVIGPSRLHKLIDIYGDVETAWRSFQLRDLASIGMSTEVSARTIQQRDKADMKGLEKIIDSKDVSVLTEKDALFPANLLAIPDHPYLIYVRGQLPDTIARAVAIVGTRRMTAYGERVIETIVPELVRAGLTIVSGLAFGVDAKVAEETLRQAQGRPVAVLASGVDNITPAANEQLGHAIIEKGGAIVSEFPLGTIPQNYYFPIRNRIISGLSLGTVVIEAAEKSGSLITAGNAAEQGREVLAVPGSIFSEESAGTNRLIKDGATPVSSAADILQALGLLVDKSDRFDKCDRDNMNMGLSADERLVFDLLAREELYVDDLSRRLGLPSSQVAVALTMLELKGLAKSKSGKWGR